MTHDPIRLLDDPSAHAALRRDLAVAARHRVPYDASAGAARLEASLAKGTGAASSGWSGSALGVGALILGGLISAGVWLSAGSSPEAERSAIGGPAGPRAPVEAPEIAEAQLPVAPAVAPQAAPAPMAVPEDMAEEAPEPAAPATAAKTAARSKVRTGGSPAKKEPAEAAPAAGPAEAIAGGADYLREARSLQAARGLLGRDPAGALARAQAGAAEFPAGAFAQEWEGVELLALFELGRRSEAEPRAGRYLDRYPKGPYAAQIREALARP